MKLDYRLIAMLILVFTGKTGFAFSSSDENDQPHQRKASLVSEGQCDLVFTWGLWKPYQYLNKDGKLVGTQIDFVRHIADQVGCQLTFKKMKFADTLANIKLGSIDFSGNVTPTPGRRDFAIFSIPYAIDYFALYLPANSAAKYRNMTLSQMLAGGFRLGVTRAHFYGQHVQQLLQDKELNQHISDVTDSYQNYERLNSGEIDGFLENPMIAAFTMRERKPRIKIERHPVIFYGNPITFMFSKKSVDISVVRAFDKVIESLQNDPDYQRKWNFRL